MLISDLKSQIWRRGQSNGPHKKLHIAKSTQRERESNVSDLEIRPYLEVYNCNYELLVFRPYKFKFRQLRRFFYSLTSARSKFFGLMTLELDFDIFPIPSSPKRLKIPDPYFRFSFSLIFRYNRILIISRSSFLVRSRI